MMMNVLAIGLVVSSLAAAGLLSPNPPPPPPPPPHKQPTITKEGHRLIVLEYEKENFPAPTTESPSPLRHIIEHAKDKFNEAASSQDSEPIPTSKEKISTAASEAAASAVHSGEAFVEKAKETIGNVVHSSGKVRDAAETESAVEGEEMIKDKCRRGFETVTRAVTSEISGPLVGVLHLMAFAVSYGVCVWVTFVSSHVLAKALPRQQFGLVQSKIYPVYFRVLAYGIGFMIMSHFFYRYRNGLVVGGRAEMFRCCGLLVSLGFVLVNMFYLEPQATKVMFERLKMEKEEGRGTDIADMVADPVLMAEASSTTTTTRVTAENQSGARSDVARQFTTTAAAAATAEQEAAKCRLVRLTMKLKNINMNSSILNVLTLMALTWHLVYLGQRLHMDC